MTNMMPFYDPAMMDDLVPNIPLKRKAFLYIAAGFAVLALITFFFAAYTGTALFTAGAAAYLTAAAFVTKKQEADNS